MEFPPEALCMRNMKSSIPFGVVCTRKSLKNTPAAGFVVGTSSVPIFSSSLHAVKDEDA